MPAPPVSSHLPRRFLHIAAFMMLCAAGMAAQPDSVRRPPQRIISLAPGITETLYTLGLAERIVGVTPYCDYPPEAKQKPQVGGLYDPNYEAILALQPDMVILLDSHHDARARLDKLGIPTLVLKHQSVADIRNSILAIGQACAAEEEARRQIKRIDEDLTALKAAGLPDKRPKVLLTIGRDFGGKRVETVYVAGRNCFYDELIELAGGVNAYQDAKVQYPMLSAEALIRINPEIVVELVGDTNGTSPTDNDILTQWKALPQISAVRSGRVHIIRGYYALRPGPRFTRFARELADIVRGNPSPPAP